MVFSIRCLDLLLRSLYHQKMARVRTKEKIEPRVPGALVHQLPRVFTDLSRLLHAKTFQLGATSSDRAKWLQANLLAHGGEVDALSSFYLGDHPPLDLPSVGFAETAGLLGPKSFGFLNNVEGVAALAAPMQERPKRGSIAVVVPTRDALPEMIPLLCRQGWGISWLVSVGQGDPAEVLRFLAMDPATTAVLVALGDGVRSHTLASVAGQKQMVLLDQNEHANKEYELCHAVARRHQIPVVGDLEEWLAYGGLHASQCAVVAETPVHIAVIGAGSDWVAKEARKSQLHPPACFSVSEIGPLVQRLQEAVVRQECWVVCGGADEINQINAVNLPAVVCVDTLYPEKVRAFLRVLSRRPRGAGDLPILVKANESIVQAVLESLPPPLYVGKRAQLEETLSDHDTKRLLHAYGVRVSRQAPANTVTAAQRIAAALSFPCVLVDPEEETEWVCHTAAELKRHVTQLLLHRPYGMVREFLSAEARLKIKVLHVPLLGPVMYANGRAMLLPLLRFESKAFLLESGMIPNSFVKGLVHILSCISSSILDQGMHLEAEICLAEEPVLVKAVGTLSRSKNGSSSKG